MVSAKLRGRRSDRTFEERLRENLGLPLSVGASRATHFCNCPHRNDAYRQPTVKAAYKFPRGIHRSFETRSPSGVPSDERLDKRPGILQCKNIS